MYIEREREIIYIYIYIYICSLGSRARSSWSADRRRHACAPADHRGGRRTAAATQAADGRGGTSGCTASSLRRATGTPNAMDATYRCL